MPPRRAPHVYLIMIEGGSMQVSAFQPVTSFRVMSVLDEIDGCWVGAHYGLLGPKQFRCGYVARDDEP